MHSLRRLGASVMAWLADGPEGLSTYVATGDSGVFALDVDTAHVGLVAKPPAGTACEKTTSTVTVTVAVGAGGACVLGSSTIELPHDGQRYLMPLRGQPSLGAPPQATPITVTVSTSTITETFRAEAFPTAARKGLWTLPAGAQDRYGRLAQSASASLRFVAQDGEAKGAELERFSAGGTAYVVVPQGTARISACLDLDASELVHADHCAALLLSTPLDGKTRCQLVPAKAAATQRVASALGLQALGCGGGGGEQKNKRRRVVVAGDGATSEGLGRLTVRVCIAKPFSRAQYSQQQQREEVVALDPDSADSKAALVLPKVTPVFDSSRIVMNAAIAEPPVFALDARLIDQATAEVVRALKKE